MPAAPPTPTDRMLASQRALERLEVLQLPGLYEYTVQSATATTMDLTPTGQGYPALQRVPMAFGLPGSSVTSATGATVYVMFINTDPARPKIVAYDGTAPVLLGLAGGGPSIGRVGDSISITPTQFSAALPVAGMTSVTITNPMQGTISSGSPKVTSG